MMPKTQKGLILIIIVFLMMGAAGCMGPTESFIQGQWVYDEEHLKNLNAEQHLTVTWVFRGGSFRYVACCFNQNEEIMGNYRILEVEEDRILIQLYNAEGVGRPIGGEVLIKIDPENDTISIMGSGPYMRVSP
jgi:hypothetical protein